MFSGVLLFDVISLYILEAIYNNRIFKYFLEMLILCSCRGAVSSVLDLACRAVVLSRHALSSIAVRKGIQSLENFLATLSPD